MTATGAIAALRRRRDPSGCPAGRPDASAEFPAPAGVMGWCTGPSRPRASHQSVHSRQFRTGLHLSAHSTVSLPPCMTLGRQDRAARWRG